MLHGSGNELRAAVTRVLLETKGHKLAFRYAACGCGDQLTKGEADAHITPRGCGHKLCPRCGRRRGGKYARRILQWLAHEAHGDLFTICLTQPGRGDEDLAAARRRMAPKQRAFMRWLSRRGLVAAQTTAHVVWSDRFEGWHYHVHVFLEVPAGCVTVPQLLEKWAEVSAPESVHLGEHQARLVLAAGPAIEELRDDGGEVDFWNEAAGQVARAVQYPVRDMAQGVSAWRLGGDDEQLKRCAFQLVTQSTGWKMYRAWGRWQRPVPSPVEPAEVVNEETGEVAGGVGATVQAGTVGQAWRRARAGDAEAREAFRLLEKSCRNQSDFAQRLVRFCRLAWGGADSG